MKNSKHLIFWEILISIGELCVIESTRKCVLLAFIKRFCLAENYSPVFSNQINVLMKRFLSSLIAILFVATTNGQQLDFTNYYLNYGKHIHDFSSSEQEGETGESESGQAGKSYEYIFDRMHTNHGFDPVQYFKVLKEESESIHPYRSLNTNFDWEFLGPNNLTSGFEHNQGRIDCFATTSSNPGVICYAGSPTSGIWKTTDSGANWSNVTDNDIPMAVGCQDIVVDPTNDNIIYASIGLNGGMENIHDIAYYGLGIYKSTDGGSSWQPTGLNFGTQVWNDNIWKIEINPNNTNQQYAISNFQVFRTNDAWNTYEIIFGVNALTIADALDQAVNTSTQTALTSHLTQSCAFKKKILVDLDVNLNNWNEVIICSAGQQSYSLPSNNGLNLYKYHPAEVWQSSNAQASNANTVNWNFVSQLADSSPSNSSVSEIVNADFSLFNEWAFLAITKKFDSPPVYNQISLFKQVSSGNWSLISNTVPPLGSSQWKLEFECSPNFQNIIYLGGRYFSKYNFITNQLLSIPPLPDYQIHDDVRNIKVFEGSNSSSEFVFVCEDGGISRLLSSNVDISATNFNGTGLNVTQIYGFDIYQPYLPFFTGGTQDNSVVYFKNGSFYKALGGDRYDGILHYQVFPDYFFSKNQGAPDIFNGLNLCQVNLNVNNTFQNTNYSGPLNTFKARWNAPFDRNWQDPNYAFVGGIGKVGKLKFTPSPIFSELVVDSLASSPIRALKVSKSNPNVMVVVNEGAYWDSPAEKKLYLTRNGGLTWLDITTAFNTAPEVNEFLQFYGINALEIDPQNPGKIYIGLNGSEVISANPLKRFFELNLNLSLNDQDMIDNAIVINLSAGLPRLPINDLQFAPTLGKDLLAATDIGLFYCDLTSSTPVWVNVNPGLPNCVITDIEFDVFHNEIYISTFGRGYWKSAMSCEPMADLHITEDSQISIPTLANHSIVVEPGVVFTVTSTLSFVENARLIVEPGGKLIVNGGTLTNGCSNAFWDGVEVRGHFNLSQTPANQGVVELKNNARINHEKCGIRTAEVLIGEDSWEYNWNSTGGIIKAENSMFLNNIKDVEFLSYSNLQMSNGQTEEENNVSYFSGCRFLVDEELFGISSLNCRISLFEVDGVKFTNSEFEIAQTSLYSQSNAGSGIYSLASSPIVRSACICTPNTFNEGNPSDITAQTLFTTSSDYTHPSLFRNFKYGIRLSGDGGIQNPVIRNSVFQDNQYGIWVGAQNATTIYRNKFIIPDLHLIEQCAGLFLGKCNHYNVSRNVFEGEANSQYNSVGVYVKDSPENANEIYLNDFDHLKYGIIAEGDQAENSPVLGGLQLLCGKYSKVTWSNSVVPNLGQTFAEIAIDQGHQTYPQITASSDLAGNLFANASTSASPFSDYFNCMGCNIIKYHAHDSNSNSAVVPDNLTSNVLVDENNIPFTSRWNACPVEHALLPEKSLLVELVELNDSIINVEKAQYYQLIDGGQTGAVVGFISNPNNSSALIRENLLPLCPYLSVTALDTLLDRTASMNPWHLSELLIACSPLDPVVLKRINNEIALPSYFLGLINEYQDGGNERLQKEIMLKAANINKNRAFGKLMELEVSSDSIVRNYSELEALFETNNDISESSMLYEIYRAQGKFEEASTVYEAYLRDTLSAEENALNDIIFEISNNGGYASADSSQQQVLQSLLNSEESIRMQVKSALELITKEPFECEFVYPEIPKSKVNRMEEEPTRISLLEVYPNPVSEDFTVGFVLPSDQRNSALNIYNNLGQLINQIDLSKDNGIHYLNARNWQSGLYILDLIVNGKVVESKSIVVKH